jgi:LCP family protein required for cell wall assembly
MGKKDQTVLTPVRSAFVAAFLSFLLPGLGHAYLRRWLRAALWMVLPLLGFAAGALLVTSTERRELLAQLVDPDVLSALLLFVIIDAVYRMLAVLDAWRLARDPLVGTGTTRTASTLGVLAIALVLAGSHVAAATPVRLAMDVVGTFDGGGDTSEIPDVSELPRELQDLVRASGAPSALPDGADRSGEPEPPPTEPIPSIEPWDRSKRLDILLVGIDSGRPGERTYLTDTMMVVSVDPVTGRMALISLPRDTVGVPLPKAADFRKARAVYGDRYAGRINSLYITARLRDDLFPGNDAQRGYRALMGALSELYGLDIQHYVSVDLNSFRGAVNAFGGLVLDVELPLLDDEYSASDGRGHLKLYVPPGIGRLNGQDALAYARSRKSTSDFDRAARQQYVVDALRDQVDLESLLEPGTIPGLRKEFEQYITTNIPAKMLPQLVLLAMDLDTRRPKSLVLSPANGFSTIQPDYDIRPNISRIRRAVKNVFKSGAKKATEDAAASAVASHSPVPSPAASSPPPEP